jgi:hypothetical protein
MGFSGKRLRRQDKIKQIILKTNAHSEHPGTIIC